MSTSERSQSSSTQKPCCDHQETKASCGVACEPIANERLRYYTGRYLTARDLTDEQAFHRSRHQLHNRLLHGWGVVCGLDVVPHKLADCQDRYVVVTPGIAIDCCGRELVLKERTVVKVWDPPPEGETPEHERPPVEQVRQEPDRPKAPEPAAPGPFLLIATYGEALTEQTPALYGEPPCESKRLEANRVREVACLKVWRKDEADDGCWAAPEPGDEERRRNCRQDCDGIPEGEGRGCIEPACPCSQGVPLALIQPALDKSGAYKIGEGAIQTEERKELPAPPEYLTHIVDHNWTHGGCVSVEELSGKDRMNGQLKVYFDRRIAPAIGMRSGINRFTFLVYRHDQRDIQYQPFGMYTDRDPPRLEEEGCVAVFPLDAWLFTGSQQLDRTWLQVVLKCDYILDCHGRPVDGSHMKGRTPTGNGMPGGTFESWFYVGSPSDREFCGAPRQRDEEQQERQEA